jgi:hypothetical protein
MDSRVVVRNRSIQLKIFTAKTPSSQRVHREKQGFPGISLGNSLLPLRELGVLAVKFFDLVHHPGIHHEPHRKVGCSLFDPALCVCVNNRWIDPAGLGSLLGAMILGLCEHVITWTSSLAHFVPQAWHSNSLRSPHYSGSHSCYGRKKGTGTRPASRIAGAKGSGRAASQSPFSSSVSHSSVNRCRAVHTRDAPGKRGLAPGPPRFPGISRWYSRAGSQSPFSSSVSHPIVNRSNSRACLHGHFLTTSSRRTLP